MFKYVAPSFIIMSCLMHVFCCGIPLLLSMTNLATMLGVSSGSLFEIEWFEAVEGKLMILSGIVLSITIAVHIISKMVTCEGETCCPQTECEDNKSIAKWLLWAACGLYAINLITLLMS